MAAKPITDAALDRLARARIKQLVADVEAARGNVKAEEKLWVAAVHALIELRAAAGNPCPSELLGHILGVDGWGPKDPPAFDMLGAGDDERERWFDYIEVATS